MTLVFICVYLISFFSRSASFSQAQRSSLLVSNDSAVQRLNGSGTQVHDSYSLPKSNKHHQTTSHSDSPSEACYVLPRTHSAEDSCDLENDEVYTYKTPCNALATAQLDDQRPPDNYDLPSTLGVFYHIPRTFDRNHNALTPNSTDSTGGPPPPRPPKPNMSSETRWGSPQSLGVQNGDVATVSVIPRRNTLPAVENIRLHRGRIVLLEDDIKVIRRSLVQSL